MRRARISIKPNFRPGNRSGSTGEQPSNDGMEADDPPPTAPVVKSASPLPSVNQNEGPESGKNVPNSPSKEALHSLNDGAPTIGVSTATAAAPQRRMRISAAPKLRPIITSTPRTSKRALGATPASLSSEGVPGSASVSVLFNNQPEITMPEFNITSEHSKTSPLHAPPSPCVPSTSGLQKLSVCSKKSVESSPPSPKSGQVPQQCLLEPGADKGSDISGNATSANPGTLTQLNTSDSAEKGGKSTDMERVLRALKLKELMKLERKKDIKREKKKVLHKEHTSLDRSNMTMRDLLYYFPNTSPLRSLTAVEGNPEETVIPPSPKVPVKTQEKEEDEEEEEEESEEDEMLVPKVRVAQDGSIILDEESLTVRVKRTANTTVMENSTTLFERGSTTTYSTFSKRKYVKSWSVRETDMFFLAISMVGTDFSMIGQLLTHRSRVAIKNKFTKECKMNGWRIDKAMQDSRPYDKEFFSYLLEKILAKDKQRGKSVKLVMTKPKKARKAKGKTYEAFEEEWLSHDVSDEDDQLENSGFADAEKENDLTDMNKMDDCAPVKKKRKHKYCIEVADQEAKSKRKSKGRKKSIKEAHTVDEIDTVNVDEGAEVETSVITTKKKRRRSKPAAEQQQDEATDGNKRKRRRKSLKGQDPGDSSICEESGIVAEQDCVSTTKKRKRSKKRDLKEGKSVEESGTESQNHIDAERPTEEEEQQPPEATETDTSLTLTDKKSEKNPLKSASCLKKPLCDLPKKRYKKDLKAKVTAEDENQESQTKDRDPFDRTLENSPSDRLQQKAVVVLERTPPRETDILSSSETQNICNENKTLANPAVTPESSSAQKVKMQRAERVKRNLSAAGKKSKGKEFEGQEAGTSTECLRSPAAQESEVSVVDSTFEQNLLDFSCLNDLERQMFQRRSMVVLSREEVDMILNVQEEEDIEDPSLSPLDLSLNTELSFPVQCSSLTMGDADHPQDNGLEGLEDGPQRVKPCNISSKEKSYEDL